MTRVTLQDEVCLVSDRERRSEVLRLRTNWKMGQHSVVGLDLDCGALQQCRVIGLLGVLAQIRS